jgi:7,8-dihydroneopterin aldolase/epimerase/oxygenase
MLQIKQLELMVHLGWPEEERKEKQQIYIDIDIFFPEPPKACETDSLDDTICYDELIKKIKHKIDAQSFKLIEHLAKVIYSEIKTAIPVDIMVHVYKNPNIEGLAKGVRFSYGDKR